MVSEQALERFHARGTLVLEAAFSASDAGDMRRLIWDDLGRRHGCVETDRSTWTIEQPTGFKALARARAFDAIGTDVLWEAVDAVLGTGTWTRPDSWGVPLVTFPREGDWDVPAAQWHLDFPVRGRPDALPGVRVLAFVSQIEPHGGGTVVLAGSHTLCERRATSHPTDAGHSSVVRTDLARTDPWLAGLFSDDATSDRVARFVDDTHTYEGVELRVEELCGGPGDVVLMHPWLFHAPAPNRREVPRFMVSHSIFAA
jgi:hypothetical protein